MRRLIEGGRSSHRTSSVARESVDDVIQGGLEDGVEAEPYEDNPDDRGPVVQFGG